MLIIGLSLMQNHSLGDRVINGSCNGAKIWDCYTGLSLCNKLGCKIKIKNSNIKKWLKKPTFLTSFHLKWH